MLSSLEKNHSPPDVISISHLQSRVADSMQQLQAWFQSNSLKMNPDKTNFILFGTKSSIAKASDFHITLPGSVIILSPTVKVLGITFDPCMTWEHHISVLVRKCNAILLSLYKIRHYFTPMPSSFWYRYTCSPISCTVCLSGAAPRSVICLACRKWWISRRG